MSKMVIKLAGARVAKRLEKRTSDAISEVCKKAKISIRPELIFGEFKEMLFATQTKPLNKVNPKIIVDVDYISLLSDKELRVVCGHEIGHVILGNDDCLKADEFSVKLFGKTAMISALKKANKIHPAGSGFGEFRIFCLISG